MSALCSIIIPVYNRAGLTSRCLDTILAEPPRVPSEIIVVDDASTDSTPQVLSRYGRNIRAVTRAINGNFGSACNDGAAASLGQYLVFLNNDTLPQRGWLDALVAYAESHPRAAVVGAKLLFPNNTVQHAGVVVCQDGFPRHVYSGFPADHPVVNRSRRFPCVTFACALVRRPVFEELGGLDTSFRNCFEDADFCLRAGEHGHEVHYCHHSVVHHLESVSRGRRSKDDAHNVQLWRGRWFGRVERDDLRYYLEDGLLRISYQDGYPLRVMISSLLALDWRDGQIDEARLLLDARSRQVLSLLQETIRLTAYAVELELQLEHEQPGPSKMPRSERRPTASSHTREELFERAHDIEDQIYDLQVELAAILGENGGSPAGPEPLAPSPFVGYGMMLRRIRELVSSTLPEGATIAVVTSGDDEFLKLNGRRALHFPQNEEGVHSGHPAHSDAAISCLEALRTKGAQYFLLPATAFWWLEHYVEFRKYLVSKYSVIAKEDDCLIVALHNR
jgi:GT2 family glycosyltransferase